MMMRCGAWPLALRRCRWSAAANCQLLRKWRQMMGESQSGFTLVEVIVALAMLSLGLSFILEMISGSIRQTARAERMGAAGSLAQSLMAEVGTALPIKSGTHNGEYPRGYRWHLSMLPYGESNVGQEGPIGLYKISAEVEWDDGPERRSYVLTTLRVGPKAAKQ